MLAQLLGNIERLSVASFRDGFAGRIFEVADSVLGVGVASVTEALQMTRLEVEKRMESLSGAAVACDVATIPV